MTPIYAGDWHDAQGVPFDAGNFARPNNPQGNVAQMRTNYDPRRTWPQHHVPTLLTLRELWHEDLTANERLEWDLIKHLCDIDRNVPAPGLFTAFVAFANRNWPLAWGYDGQYMPDPVNTIGNLQTATIQYANHITQRIGVRLTFDVPPEFNMHSTTYVYHINPDRHNSSVNFRFTRLADAFRHFNDVDLVYNFEVPAQWALVPGWNCLVYFRHTYNFSWRPNIVDTAVIT